MASVGWGCWQPSVRQWVCLRPASPTGSPIEGLGGQRMKAHLDALAWGLASAVRALCTHPDLLRRWESNWIHPVRHSRSPHCPDRGALVHLHPCPLGPRRSTGADKGGSGDAANGETLPQQATSRFAKIGKKEKKKKLLGCNVFLGNMLLKGIYMPWKQIPEAQFQLISAKLATANEHCNCQ